MQLRDGADIAAALPVDRDHRLDADLEFVADPDDAGLMVPVVSVPELAVFPTGVCNDASTNGMR